jgi:hypothetical protein
MPQMITSGLSCQGHGVCPQPGLAGETELGLPDELLYLKPGLRVLVND